jgi:uncharacterized membrane protein YgcG
MQMRGLHRLRLLSLIAVFLLAGLSCGIAAEVIHSFDSHVILDKSGELTVTERIRVRAEGSSIKRGIYRDFPLIFTDAQGRRREVNFKLLEVTRDGKPEPHFTERKSGGVIRIYAGDKDVLLSRGDYTYVFRYRTARQVRWFDTGPELNWNVTGNFWTFPILTASYRLELADGLRPVRWTAFTGPLGARGTDYRVALNSDGALVVTTTRPLQAGEGLTVVAALPEGAVEPPTQAAELWYAFMDNRGWILGGFGFLLVLGYYLAAWNAVGRDPKGSTIIPLFYPPKGVSPALANYIENWGISRDKWRAFTAAALSLAVKGLVRFGDKDGELTLRRTGKPDGGNASLPAGERAIASWLDGQDGTARIDSSNSSAVGTISKNFTSAIETENRNRFFRRNLGYVLAGAAMTVAVIIGILIFGGLAETDLFIVVFIAFGSVWLGMFLVPITMALFGAVRFASIVRAVMTLIVLGIFASIAAQALQGLFDTGLGEIFPFLWSLLGDHPVPFTLVASFATLNGLFLYLMRAPTALGRPIMDQLAGFKLYLETAESDRLNLGAPEITAERFEALLPYAVALNVEEPWSEAFAAALQRAYPGEADPVDRHYRPDWHSGSWSGRSLGSAVASTVASTASALSSAMPVSSSSSGFSSGGGGSSSGGGGGGGGGGGW